MACERTEGVAVCTMLIATAHDCETCSRCPLARRGYVHTQSKGEERSVVESS